MKTDLNGKFLSYNPLFLAVYKSRILIAKGISVYKFLTKFLMFCVINNEIWMEHWSVIQEIIVVIILDNFDVL